MPHQQGLNTSLFKQIGQDLIEKNGKAAVGKKDLKNACAKNWDPYNAPPSTRQM
ncbi:hypothetical protein LJPFL01_3816 [Lelliottia jeotgali]|nr:hypothetical protein LJPFL01_3816 [Lelliottia jeotgali]